MRRLLTRMTIVILAGGLLGATLVRMAPGFGMDERLLDPRLSQDSLRSLEQIRSEGEHILPYYLGYLHRLSEGDLGTSISLGRPVRELIGERIGVSARSCAWGLAMAWAAAILGVAVLQSLRLRWCDRAASVAAGGLLSIPAAVLALICLYTGAGPAAAMAAILFPRLFRYTRDVVGTAARAPHVLAARAAGIRPGRILAWQVAAPVAPELAALAGVSISMAAGSLIPVEALCDSPGIGQLVWQAALARDLPVIVAVTLMMTVLTVAANTAADTVREART